MCTHCVHTGTTQAVKLRCNPSHGILDLWLDGVGIAMDLDWCDEVCTSRQTCRAPVVIPWTGTHRLLARVDRTSADPSRRNGFWMCLHRISFRREGSIATISEGSEWTIQRRAL